MRPQLHNPGMESEQVVFDLFCYIIIILNAKFFGKDYDEVPSIQMVYWNVVINIQV